MVSCLARRLTLEDKLCLGIGLVSLGLDKLQQNQT